MSGLRPNVLNSRLNQTTSGLSRWRVFSNRNVLPGSSKDQQRRTVNPSGSACGLRQFIGQDGQAEKRIALQLLRKVESVFTQSSGAWEERLLPDRSSFASRFASARSSMCFRKKMLAGAAKKETDSGVRSFRSACAGREAARKNCSAPESARSALLRNRFLDHVRLFPLERVGRERSRFRTRRLSLRYASRFLRTKSSGYSGLRVCAASGSASTTNAISGFGVNAVSSRA